MELINHQQAIEALHTVVAEAGRDYVYVKPNGDDCFYVWDGKPSCGVGRALHHLGVPIKTLRLWEGCNAHTLWQDLAGELYSNPMARPPLTTPLAARVFQMFQARQDDGKPWGEALAAADREYESMIGAVTR